MKYDNYIVNRARPNMFTQTHLLLGAAIFAKPGSRTVAVAGLMGALVPDSDVWLMFVVERVQGSTGCEVFHYRYWEEPWTALQMVLNSIPAYLALLVVSLVCLRLQGEWIRTTGTIGLVFASSALLHVGSDFLLHHDDARAQWMPFTEWVFRSPVSYWDPTHHGQIFMSFEIGLGLALIILVGRRFRTRWVWAALVVLSLGYGGSIAASFMSGGDHARGPGSCEGLTKTTTSDADHWFVVTANSGGRDD